MENQQHETSITKNVDESYALFEKLLEKHCGTVEDAPASLSTEAPDLTKIPLAERLQSTNWEYRLHGIQFLKDTLCCQTDISLIDDPSLVEYARNLHKFLTDSNGNVQRVSLDLGAVLFLRIDEASCKNIWENTNLYTCLVEKTLIQSRLFDQSVNLLASLLERMDPACFSAPFYKTLQAISPQSPKTPLKGPVVKRLIGLFNCLEKLIRLFGLSLFDTTEILKEVSSYTNVSDASIKKAAYSLLFEIYLWTNDKDLVTRFVSEKPKAELLRRFNEQRHHELLVPSRLCRASTSLVDHSSTEANVPSPNISIQSAPKSDFENICPADIFKIMPPELLERRINQAVKWKEKVEALNELTQTCEKLRRLKPGDYGLFISILQRILQLEGNLAVTVSAIKSCTALALVLREQFSPYLRTVGTISFHKIKDRNRSVLASIISLLKAILLCGPFDVYFDDFLKAMSDKQPYVRNLALQWAIYALEHPMQKDTVAHSFSKLFECILEALDDPTEQVRSRATQVVQSVLKGSHGDAARRLLEARSSPKNRQVHDILLRDDYQPNTQNMFYSPRVDACTSIKPQVKPWKNNPASSVNPPAVATVSKVVKPTPHRQTDIPVGPIPELSLELDAAYRILEPLVPQTSLAPSVAKFHSAAWKERVEGFDGITETLKTVRWSESDVECEAVSTLIRFEGVKNFTETNTNVLKRALQFCILLIDMFHTHFSNSCAALFLNGFIDKLSDAKLKPYLIEFLERYAAQNSFFCVLNYIMSPQMYKKATPKVRAEVCIVAEQFLLRYGYTPGNYQYIVEYALHTLNDRFPASRTAALHFLAVLYTAQPSLISSLVGVSPNASSVMDNITRASSSLPKDKHIVATMALDGCGTTTSARQVEESKGEQRKVLDSAIKGPNNTPAQPNEPLRGHLNNDILKKFSGPKWSTRKEAVMQVQKMILHNTTTGGLASYHGLQELLSVLRNRIHEEPNRSVLRELLVLLNLLAPVLGQTGVKCSIRNLLPLVFQKLADKNATIREICIKTATTWLHTAGVMSWLSCLHASQILAGAGEEKEPIMCILASIDSALLHESTAVRLEGSNVLESLVASILEVCQDRSKTLRQYAETFLIKFAPFAPPGTFQKAIKLMRLSHQANAKPFISKCLELASSNASHCSFDTNNTTERETSTVLCGKSVANEDVNESMKADAFVLKLTALSVASSGTKLEHYRKAKWPAVPSLEEISFLTNIWRHFANVDHNSPIHKACVVDERNIRVDQGQFDAELCHCLVCGVGMLTEKLVIAMLDKSQPFNTMSDAFTFWEKIFNDKQTLYLLVSPHKLYEHNFLIDIVIRWLVVRIFDLNSKVSMAACFTFSVLQNALVPLAKDDSQMFSVASSSLLHSALPHLLERLAVTTKTATHLRDKLLVIIRHIVTWCAPQPTFQLLTRLIASNNKKLVSTLVEELGILCQLHGARVSSNLKRDIVKLTSFYSMFGDAQMKMGIIKAIAAWHPSVEAHVLLSLIPQPDVREKLITLLKRHSTTLSTPAEFLGKEFISDEGSCVSKSQVTSTTAPDDTMEKVPSGHSLAEDSPSQQMEAPQLSGSEPQNNDSTQGARDFLKDWETSLAEHTVTTRLDNIQDSLSQYFYQFAKREEESLHQDLSEECRRVLEGRLEPNASHIAYWNGVMRLNDTKHSVQGETLIISDLLRTMNRRDPFSIAQSSKALYFFFYSENTHLDSTTRQRDWKVVFASELINVLIFALKFCFDTEKTDRSPEEKETLLFAGTIVTQLANRILRDKGVLQRISLIQLRELYRALLIAMSAHAYWAAYKHGTEIARRLNSIIARDLMALVIPRNACHLFSMMFDFLLYSRDTLNPSLVLRAHRKLVTKLNVKHSPLPPTSEEIPYYLRSLDIAIIALKQLDSCTDLLCLDTLIHFPPCLRGEDQPSDHVQLQKVKTQIEILIKEIVFLNLVILGPALAGVYFRDLGFINSSGENFKSYETTTDVNKLPFRVNQRLSGRLEKLMNTPFSVELTATVCPNITSYATDDNPNVQPKTYQAFTNDFFNASTKQPLRTPPISYPLFCFSFFLSAAPQDVTLEMLDQSLAAGWSSRRDIKAGTDIKPLYDYLPEWICSLESISESISVPLNTAHARDSAVATMSRGLVHYELLGKYVRKTLDVASNCHIIPRSDLMDTAPISTTLCSSP